MCVCVHMRACTEVESATRISVQTHEGYFSICKDVHFFNLVLFMSYSVNVSFKSDNRMHQAHGLSCWFCSEVI